MSNKIDRLLLVSTTNPQTQLGDLNSNEAMASRDRDGRNHVIKLACDTRNFRTPPRSSRLDFLTVAKSCRPTGGPLKFARLRRREDHQEANPQGVLAGARRCGETTASRHQLTEAAEWKSLADVRRTFPTADAVGRLTVFNIKGNTYRLVVRLECEFHLVFIRWFGTHAEYDKRVWQQDEWF
jgi:mRNA interferase HigB